MEKKKNNNNRQNNLLKKFDIEPVQVKILPRYKENLEGFFKATSILIQLIQNACNDNNNTSELDIGPIVLLLEEISSCLTQMGICECLEPDLVQKKTGTAPTTTQNSLEEEEDGANERKTANKYSMSEEHFLKLITVSEQKRKKIVRTWASKSNGLEVTIPWEEDHRSYIEKNLTAIQTHLQLFCIKHYGKIHVQLMEIDQGDFQTAIFSHFKHITVLHLFLMTRMSMMMCEVYLKDVYLRMTEERVLKYLREIKTFMGENSLYEPYLLEQHDPELDIAGTTGGIDENNNSSTASQQPKDNKISLNAAAKMGNWWILFWNCLSISSLVDIRQDIQITISNVIETITPYLIKQAMDKQPVVRYQFPTKKPLQYLNAEEICILVFFWQRKMVITQGLLRAMKSAQLYQRVDYRTAYIEQKTHQMQREAIRGINNGNATVLNPDKVTDTFLEARSSKVWEELSKIISAGSLEVFRAQDFKNYVYKVMIAPGIYQGYCHIYPSWVESAVGIGEQTLNRTLMYHSSVFFACNLETLTRARLDPSIIAPSPDPAVIKPCLIPGMYVTDPFYRRIQIIIFMFTLDRITIETLDTKFLETHLFFDPVIETLLDNPLSVAIICSNFYLVTAKRKLWKVPEDIEFADIYLREMEVFRDMALYRCILERFANTHGPDKDKCP